MITKEAPRDAIDVLLNDTSGQLTDDLIAGNNIDMMIPGEDSVLVLLTLPVKYLSDCPAALQQLLEENIKLKRLKDQLREPLCWSDYLSLPFTQTVITETLRLGNIIIGVMTLAIVTSPHLEVTRGYALGLTWLDWKLPSFYTPLSLNSGEAVFMAFQHYILALGTTVMIPSFLVPYMGGTDAVYFALMSIGSSFHAQETAWSFVVSVHVLVA
ncbi:3-epi-6-deoxocathasterone 23-monooxygenase CYP90D1-like [Humulus lupulus]|uniref:3-epi-6-deoxocathasterone 23-monooxygenase CYP90D1-like n=1 Tax=Humulus lupulus TaxID=3486 RepID=UPI002B4181E6|nr:3-epi-6-deoxocathasterone 23-monooxygenase CYP90D1-like [Humulus lupulus]